MVEEGRTWGEFGGRVGYHLTREIIVDAFANGIAGGGLETSVHVGGDVRFRF